MDPEDLRRRYGSALPASLRPGATGQARMERSSTLAHTAESDDARAPNTPRRRDTTSTLGAEPSEPRQSRDIAQVTVERFKGFKADRDEKKRAVISKWKSKVKDAGLKTPQVVERAPEKTGTDEIGMPTKSKGKLASSKLEQGNTTTGAARDYQLVLYQGDRETRDGSGAAGTAVGASGDEQYQEEREYFEIIQGIVPEGHASDHGLEPPRLLELQRQSQENAERSEDSEDSEEEQASDRQANDHSNDPGPEEKDPEGAHERRTPVYPRVHSKYLLIETLRHYNIPWERDRFDNDYFILLQEMTKKEVDALFEHTSLLRNRKALDDEAYVDKLLAERGPLPWQRVIESIWQIVAENYYRRQREDKDSVSSRSSSRSSRSSNDRRNNDSDTDGEISTSEDSSEDERERSSHLNNKRQFVRDNRQIPPPSPSRERRGEDQAPWFKTGRSRPTLTVEPDLINSRDAELHAVQPVGTRFTALQFGLPVDSAQLLRKAASTNLMSPCQTQPSKVELPLPNSSLQCVIQSAFREPSHPDRQRAPQPSFRTLRAFTGLPDPALFFVKHFNHDTPSFDLFKNQILSIPELAAIRDQVHDHLTWGWTPEDGDARVTGHMDTSPRPYYSSDLSIVPLCIPFVYLTENGRTSMSANGPPAQTLFQSLYPKGDRRRDFRQAICQISGSKRNYLCVSQLWAVLIQKELLVTCAAMSEEVFYGELLSPIPWSFSSESLSRCNLSDVRVTSPDDRLWLLNREDCTTYLDFASHFFDITAYFYADFLVLHNGQEILPHQWFETFANSKGGVLHLSLKRRPAAESDPDDEFGFDDVAEKMLGLQYQHPENTLLRESARDLDLRCLRLTDQPPTSTDGLHPVDQSLLASQQIHRMLSILKVLTATTDGMIGAVGQTAVRVPQQPGQTGSQNGRNGKPPAWEADRMDYDKINVEDLLIYQDCRSLSVEEFVEQLGTWSSETHSTSKAAEMKHLDDRYEEPIILDVDLMSRASGKDEKLVTTCDILIGRCDLMYASIFNGLKALLRLLHAYNGNPEYIDGLARFRGAVFNFQVFLHSTIFPWPKFWAADLLYKTFVNFRHLLWAAAQLEAYGFDHRKTSQEDIGQLLKQSLLAILLATGAARRLELLYEQPFEEGQARSVGEEIYHLITRMRRLQAGGYKLSNYWQAYRDQIKELQRREARHLSAPRSIQAASRLWETQSSLAKTTAEDFMRLYERSLRAGSKKLTEMAAAGPADLLTALAQRVTHFTVFGDSDAHSMYMAYMRQLETEIWEEPSRGLLDRLRYIRYELNALSQIQASQGDAMERFFNRVEPAFGYHRDRPIGPWTGSVLNETLETFQLLPDKQYERGAWALYSLVEQLQTENSLIRLLDNSIQPLQDECRAHLSGVEDWRNNAAVVFTVITILFLPPSFVASVLGMNTADVRNTSLNQWAYWAAALPLTITVIAVTLWFVDVPPLRRWWDRRREKRV